MTHTSQAPRYTLSECLMHFYADTVHVHVAMTRLNPLQTAVLMVFTLTMVFLVMNPGNKVISVPSNPLDGCVYVYLDMGTNVGVQIRNGNL